ncbi:MAG: DUF2178 domain-containing protein [Candidatus Shapirobacteria bacterium]|nr:DUF2178 domain-containing protein [Candidatus Shapirobacteria bacterium]MDD5073561.1 DUF2178 domain-containing protein [Candidatus Shapirobacteria bacterium]MDD5481946.1 DUF2178 domain-containing protein [Candidatus Shapirobacteria bacterium]
MNNKKYRQIRVLVIFFVGIIVAISLLQDSFLLSAVGIITGLLFLVLVRSKTKIRLDEREKTIREKAANLTYAIFAPTIGIGAFLLLFPTHSGLSVFAKGEFYYLESLGMVFAYLALFLIIIYALSYHFLNKKYGGGGNGE